MTVSEAKRNFSQVVAAAERGETIVITRNGRPVVKVGPEAGDRTSDPERRAVFAALKTSLQTKCARGYRVGTITEDQKYS